MSKNKYEVQVVPVDDFREHELSASCWCKPTIEDSVVTHTPADGRNLLEDIVLGVQEIPSHLSRVAALCFEGVGEADSNESTALEWLGIRIKRCQSLGDSYPSRTAFAQYIENVLEVLNRDEKEARP